MEYIRKFESLSKQDVGLAGGKGASLGEMTQAGIPVPPGFVILSETFEAFLEKADLIQEIEAVLHTVDHEQIHTVENASEKIHALIMMGEVPQDIRMAIEKEFVDLDAELVAVRSSATAEDSAAAAWAGQLESYLNTTKERLMEHVKKCWASLFTPRAIFYRFEKGLHGQKISVAVVVQKMVQAETAGVAFSVHPVTQDRNQLIIEAVAGLGEALVSGQVTPDSYVVEKKEKRIIDKNIQDAMQKLSDEEILELSDLVVHIENHYGFPVDVEWAREGGKFYIVQSRPITTLNDQAQPKQTFVKAYTRNFSIIMQQAWFAANKENLISTLGLMEYPYNPPYLYYMRDGVEEVWENTRANRWLLNKLVEKMKTNDSFFSEIYARYFERLKQIEPWWKKEIHTLEELKIFIDLMEEGVSDFVILYGALMDENLPKKEKELAKEFREKDVFFSECNRTIGQALRNIYPELGYHVVYITREELEKKIDPEELKKRDQGFAFIPGIFQDTISFEEFVNRFPEYQFEIERVELGEEGLRGQSAYRGRIRGRVRIVKRTDQAEQLAEGEIIVSPMTTPDFVPAMKKAAAFVTDEGGITCHAAIIAREMKKPCLIGTKVATQVLHDGDEVEVDANQGVVRILKRNSV
ncbi:hypothetical protein FJZ48_00895 [Candidatus Uhrbacteria bacterium]|nr:hypothetical protein [Candidatus Uhrbacteria bacterium]